MRAVAEWLVNATLLLLIPAAAAVFVTAMAMTRWGFWAASVTPMAVAIALAILRWLRRRRGELALGYLDQAVRMNSPLPETIVAAARSEAGALGRGLLTLYVRLLAGDPVASAVRAGVPEVGERAIEIIAVGERVGRLRQALAYLVEANAARVRRPTPADAYLLAYPPMVLLMTFLVGMGYSVLVEPKYVEIASDMGVTLNRVSLSVGDWTRVGAPLLALVVFWVVFAAFTWLAWVSTRRWMAASRHPLRSVCEEIAAWIPLLGPAMSNRSWADAFALLAASMDADLPLESAVNESTQLDLAAPVHRRLVRWHTLMDAGRPPIDAARRAGLPPMAVGMIEAARVAGAMGDAMRFLSRHYESRFSRGLILMRSMLAPAAVAALAIVVGLFAYGLVMPMIQFIDQALANTGLIG